MAEVGSGYRRRKNPRGVRFNHWRAPNCGLQLGENLTSLYAARPPQRAARIGALINFIGSSCTAVSELVQWPPAIPAVSLYRRGRSDYEYFSA
jgi:hypothetical protein